MNLENYCKTMHYAKSLDVNCGTSCRDLYNSVLETLNNKGFRKAETSPFRQGNYFCGGPENNIAFIVNWLYDNSVIMSRTKIEPQIGQWFVYVESEDPEQFFKKYNELRESEDTLDFIEGTPHMSGFLTLIGTLTTVLIKPSVGLITLGAGILLTCYARFKSKRVVSKEQEEIIKTFRAFNPVIGFKALEKLVEAYAER